MRAGRAKSFRVVAWPKWSPSNVYTGALSQKLEEQRDVEVHNLDMHWKMIAKAVLRPVQIQHVHWLERSFWAPTSTKMIRQIVHIWLVTHIMRLRGARMVWTAHDPEPHRSPINAALFHGWSGWLWRHYRRHMLKRVDGVLLMSESHRATVRANFSSDRNVPMAVVPHPHYRGQYLDTITRQDARGLHGIEGDTPVVAFIGALREYKNPDGLLNAFHQMSRDAVLLMAGSTESDHHSHLYEELAARDGRVKLTCGFVPDDELQDWFRAADLVILPYRKVTNSGSAHLALSFDLPVLVPDEPIFVELERLVGGDWVRRYSGELSGPIIEDALTWIRQPRPAAPDLSEIDWQTIAGRTLDFYKSVARPGRA